MNRLVVGALLFLTGCTTVHDLGGGRYIVPRTAEVRSPFGTNMGFVMLETCDGVDRKESGLQPLFPTKDYINCQGLTDWQPMSSQGQGGQIVSGVLQASGLLGLGALVPSAGSTAIQSQSVTVAPAAKGHH